MMKRNLVLLLLFILISLSSNARQKSDEINGNFNGLTFQKFAEEVARQTPYKFYYRDEWIDSLVISAEPYQGALAPFLLKIFEGTELKFAIGTNHKVFITKERSIATWLAVGFFPEETVVRKEGPASTSADFDYSEYETRGTKQKSREEKLYTIGNASDMTTGPVTISGYVLNLKSGEPVIGASIFVEGTSGGAMTDPSGFYWLTLPKGRQALRVQSIGMKTIRYQLLVYGPGKFTIEMDEVVVPLKEVVIEANRDARVNSTQMGVERLDIKTIKAMPSFLGEVDVLKVMLTLPGVQSVGEGASGLNVRGGSTNQNLILYNDAVVYNPAHVFGFFSVFNPDVLKSVDLYKSGITADFGGRLSSVMDISSREGNYKKFVVSGGLSPITGRLTVEGPIAKDRTSFLFGIRSTYSSWLLKQFKTRHLKNSKASFYDINFNINHKFDDKNTLQLSAYTSRDRFTLNSDTLYEYSDQNASIKWKRIFNNKFYGTLTGSYSRYKYEVSADENPINAFTLGFRVRQFGAKADLEYFPSTKHTIKGGAQITHYGIAPGTLDAVGSASILIPDKLQHEQGIESAVHLGDSWDITPSLTLYAGIRYSLYQYLGPRDVFEYADGISRSENSIIDTVSYTSRKAIATYHGAEPRFSVRYLLGKKSSIKLSYTRMRQYIQMLSNTIAIAPTDTWKLSDSYIKPQVADQYAVGLYKNLNSGVEISVEGYYKVMENSLDFKDGAIPTMNHHIETDVLNADGKAYGVELMVRKSVGKLNGWVSYTYSRSLLQTKAALPIDQINGGKYYPSSYDKPHAANIIGNYKVSRRFNMSLNIVYSTGRPITIPLAKYEQNGQLYLYYSDRNEYRIPNYFRMDFSMNVEGNHRIKKLAHSSWTFGVYNLTGRKNAYSIYFVPKGDRIKAYKLSVFAFPIPTITYNFRF